MEQLNVDNLQAGRVIGPVLKTKQVELLVDSDNNGMGFKQWLLVVDWPKYGNCVGFWTKNGVVRKVVVAVPPFFVHREHALPRMIFGMG